MFYRKASLQGFIKFTIQKAKQSSSHGYATLLNIGLQCRRFHANAAKFLKIASQQNTSG